MLVFLCPFFSSHRQISKPSWLFSILAHGWWTAVIFAVYPGSPPFTACCFIYCSIEKVKPRQDVTHRILGAKGRSAQCSLDLGSKLTCNWSILLALVRLVLGNIEHDYLAYLYKVTDRLTFSFRPFLEEWKPIHQAETKTGSFLSLSFLHWLWSPIRELYILYILSLYADKQTKPVRILHS